MANSLLIYNCTRVTVTNTGMLAIDVHC